MIAVALPVIADDFEARTAAVMTLITLYLVVMLAGQPIAGRITDAFGARKSVLVALVGLGVFSFGAALGPVIGGLLVQSFWWQAIFLFNVPIAAVDARPSSASPFLRPPPESCRRVAMSAASGRACSLLGSSQPRSPGHQTQACKRSRRNGGALSVTCECVRSPERQFDRPQLKPPPAFTQSRWARHVEFA